MEKLLKTRRLLLRPLGTGDLETVHAYASVRENCLYMVRLPNGSRQETGTFLQVVEAEWRKERPDFYEFAVTLNGRQIGAVSVYPDETGTDGELGWIFHRDFWGQGYAIEAAEAVRDFALSELGLRRLIAHCDARNTGSFRIMEKLGMVRVDETGVRRNRTFPDEDVPELTYVLNR